MPKFRTQRIENLHGLLARYGEAPLEPPSEVLARYACGHVLSHILALDNSPTDDLRMPVDRVGDLVRSFAFHQQRLQLRGVSDVRLLLEQLEAMIRRWDLYVWVAWRRLYQENLVLLRRGDSEWPPERILLQVVSEAPFLTGLSEIAYDFLRHTRADHYWLRRVDLTPLVPAEGLTRAILPLRSEALAVIAQEDGSLLIPTASGEIVEWRDGPFTRTWATTPEALLGAFALGTRVVVWTSNAIGYLDSEGQGTWSDLAPSFGVLKGAVAWDGYVIAWSANRLACLEPSGEVLWESEHRVEVWATGCSGGALAAYVSADADVVSLDTRDGAIVRRFAPYDHGCASLRLFGDEVGATTGFESVPARLWDLRQGLKVGETEQVGVWGVWSGGNRTLLITTGDNGTTYTFEGPRWLAGAASSPMTQHSNVIGTSWLDLGGNLALQHEMSTGVDPVDSWFVLWDGVTGTHAFNGGWKGIGVKRWLAVQGARPRDARAMAAAVQGGNLLRVLEFNVVKDAAEEFVLLTPPLPHGGTGAATGTDPRRRGNVTVSCQYQDPEPPARAAVPRLRFYDELLGGVIGGARGGDTDAAEVAATVVDLNVGTTTLIARWLGQGRFDVEWLLGDGTILVRNGAALQLFRGARVVGLPGIHPHAHREQAVYFVDASRDPVAPPSDQLRRVLRTLSPMGEVRFRVACTLPPSAQPQSYGELWATRHPRPFEMTRSHVRNIERLEGFSEEKSRDFRRYLAYDSLPEKAPRLKSTRGIVRLLTLKAVLAQESFDESEFDWDDAARLALNIEDEETRCAAIEVLASALLESSQAPWHAHQSVRTLADRLTDLSAQQRLLARLAGREHLVTRLQGPTAVKAALARESIDWDQAERMALATEDVVLRDAALVLVTSALLESPQTPWHAQQRVRPLANEISSSAVRERILAQLSEVESASRGRGRAIADRWETPLDRARRALRPYDDMDRADGKEDFALRRCFLPFAATAMRFRSSRLGGRSVLECSAAEAGTDLAVYTKKLNSHRYGRPFTFSDWPVAWAVRVGHLWTKRPDQLRGALYQMQVAGHFEKPTIEHDDHVVLVGTRGTVVGVGRVDAVERLEKTEGPRSTALLQVDVYDETGNGREIGVQLSRPLGSCVRIPWGLYMEALGDVTPSMRAAGITWPR